MTEYKVYLDSDVFISLVRTEIDGQFSLRFQESRLFFTLCVKQGIKVVLSEALFREVKNAIGLGKEDVVETVREMGVVIEEICCTGSVEKSVEDIMKRTGIHKSDAMHVSLAIQAGCDLIATWNKKDFEKTRSLIAFATPKDFASGFSDTHQPADPYPRG